ncbi:MAG TPA: chemotaxis protein CheW [Pseudomonadales bacterium]|nr:chemotaxis protein CheW [Pseudomonadales bacterium]
MAEADIEIPTFIVPLQKSNILVPNAAVAEIIPYEPLQRVQDSPDWFLGFLGWRGVQVPVVSFEMLTVRRGSFSLVSVSSASLVILKALGGQEDLKFFAIVAQALPRLVRITSEELFVTDELANKTELSRARYADDIVSIPDLDYIEFSIREVTTANT